MVVAWSLYLAYWGLWKGICGAQWWTGSQNPRNKSLHSCFDLWLTPQQTYTACVASKKKILLHIGFSHGPYMTFATSLLFLHGNAPKGHVYSSYLLKQIVVNTCFYKLLHQLGDLSVIMLRNVEYLISKLKSKFDWTGKPDWGNSASATSSWSYFAI